MRRPIGVWCYDENTNELVKPENWTNNNVSGGVVVVTEEHAFRVLPHDNISLQWGSPTAEFCKSVGGYLPSVVKLKTMANNIKAINKCMKVMGQPTLPIGWYWSSVEEYTYALSVYLYDGSATYCLKEDHITYVRAVSTFQL